MAGWNEREASVRMGEHDVEHIWLRQSVTYSADGQTRTLEIAIPMPRGCTPAELDVLLDEADAGMARLTRLLDARVAGQPAAVAALSAPAAQEVAPAPAEAPPARARAASPSAPRSRSVHPCPHPRRLQQPHLPRHRRLRQVHRVGASHQRRRHQPDRVPRDQELPRRRHCAHRAQAGRARAAR